MTSFKSPAGSSDPTFSRQAFQTLVDRYPVPVSYFLLNISAQWMSPLSDLISRLCFVLPLSLQMLHLLKPYPACCRTRLLIPLLIHSPNKHWWTTYSPQTWFASANPPGTNSPGFPGWIKTFSTLVRQQVQIPAQLLQAAGVWCRMANQGLLFTSPLRLAYRYACQRCWDSILKPLEKQPPPSLHFSRTTRTAGSYLALSSEKKR